MTEPPAPAPGEPLALLRIEHAVAEVMVGCRTGEAAFDRGVAAVGPALGWEHVRLWTPSRSGRLICRLDWNRPGSAAEAAGLKGVGRLLELGEGVAGRAWESGEPQWTAAVDTGSDAIPGARGAFAFPLEGGAGVVAITEAFASGAAAPSPELLATLVSVGRRVGQVVDHHRAEQKVARSEGRKRAILDAALDCVVTIDGEGYIVETNAALEPIFGWTPDEARGREMAELIVPPELRDAHRAGLARLGAGGAPSLLGRRVELTGLRRDGRRFPVELAITRVDVPGELMFAGHIRDITARLQAETELRASRTRVQAAADEARRRLERDLHDGAQQRLAGLSLALGLISHRLKTDPATGIELLEAARVELREATAELRELARGIHPAVLTDSGLEPALIGLAGRCPVPVAVRVDFDERLPAPIEAAAYFLIAEALANAGRHAAADKVEVWATVQDGHLEVGVRDDGVGGAAEGGGSGLRGLADRMAGLDGTVHVVSAPGEGTTITAHLPLRAASEG